MTNDLVLAPDLFSQVPRSSRKATVWGYAILVLGVGGFFAWSAFAPLDGAVVSPGNFVATSQNKIVQHLEGGIIKEILVKEGETAEAGQTLMRLDATASSADLTRLEIRHIHLMATMARLEAQAAGRSSFDFPSELVALAGDKNQTSLLDRQRQVFTAQQNKLASDIEIQDRTAAAYEEQIKGYVTRFGALKDQLSFIEIELEGKEKLYKAGLVRKPEYFALQRSKSALGGEQARILSEMEDARQRMSAAKQASVRARQAAVQQAAEELQTASGELKDVAERIGATRAALSRLEIKAPVRGTVVKMNYHTAGGVIRPGADILALLPAADELVIEAHIRPQDIANVKTGQEALVRLSALNQRTTPMVPGQVIFVSADALPNEKAPMHSDNIYVARVELDPKHTVHIDGFQATPGMPAEVFIKTGQHTFLEYLVKPVRDTMSRAFRER